MIMDTLCKIPLWLGLMLLLGPLATAQTTVSKKIKETYALTDAGELELENKYGDITIFGWDKDEVQITISIEVDHRKKETANDLVNRVKPIIQQGNDLVSVRYEIAEKNSGFFAELFEKANPFDYDRSNIQVDYEVYLPRKAELKANNAFGDVIVEDWSGELRAIIEHGDLWLNDDLGRADVSMKYGKLRAKSITRGTLTLKNGELDMEDAERLNLTTSGTDITMDKVTALELNSSKDKMTLEEVSSLHGSLKFTTLRLNRLIGNVDMTLKIADFQIAEISDSEADITLDQESSEVSLNVTDFAHRLNATLEEGLVRLPKSYKNIDSQMLDESKKLREIRATYGENTQGSISLTGKKGTVLLKEME